MLKLVQVCFVLIIASFTFSSQAKAGETFEKARASTPSLVPSTKPLKVQSNFSETNVLKGLASLTKALETNVKKKVEYSSSRTRAAKDTLNQKLDKSLELIKTRNTFAGKRIRTLAAARAEVLYAAAAKDQDESIESAQADYTKYSEKVGKKKTKILKKLKKKFNKKVGKIKKSNKKPKQKRAKIKAGIRNLKKNSKKGI